MDTYRAFGQPRDITPTKHMHPQQRRLSRRQPPNHAGSLDRILVIKGLTLPRLV